MSRLIWSPSSLDDLATIAAYIAQYDGRAAVRILQAIRSAADRLLDYPRTGRALDAPFRVIGVRTTAYLIVYRLRGDWVEIARIRHGREDRLGEIEAEV